jgi:hypothetical protein
MTSVADFKIALNSADLNRDLVVGLYGGTALAGVTGVTLDINANGVDVSKSFTDVGANIDYFNDNAIDLRSLQDAAYASGTVNLAITLKVTADAPNSGFFGHFIVTG